jgi:Lysozyme inhibitor LprI
VERFARCKYVLGLLLWSACTDHTAPLPPAAKTENAKEAAPSPAMSFPVAEPVPAADPDDPYVAPRARCQPLLGRPFPDADRPTTAQRALLKPGDSVRYFYGIGVPVDYVKARHAAYLEIDAHDSALIGGEQVLMMLYANGFGVPRNLPLAMSLACFLEGAPAEMRGRIDHLEALASGPGKRPFDLCDDVTSGMMEGVCAWLDEERARAKRERALARLTASWPDAHRAALNTLQQTAQAFQDARAAGELDLSGTLRNALIIGEEAAQRELILKAVERFERGKFPVHSAEDHARADAELNTAYAHALAALKEGGMSTATPEGLRAAERAWLGYRKAFLAFVALRYGGAPSEAIDTWLIGVRTKQLSEL